MMKGMICLFFGLIAAIPDGWFLCDGNNDTPDLRNKFIFGAGGAAAPGVEGGSINHTHPYMANTHFHDMPAGTDLAAGAGFYDSSSLSSPTGTTDPGTSLPPYYALSYIMKEG